MRSTTPQRTRVLEQLPKQGFIVWVLHALGLGRRNDWQGVNTPLDTLKHRFARGEIDRAEYEERKKALLGS